MITLPVNATVHRVHTRSAARQPAPAYRRIYSRIRSNQAGSSFDTVREIPLRTREMITYSRIRSNGPGASYDTVHRARVPQTGPGPDDLHAQRAAAGGIFSLLKVSLTGRRDEAQTMLARPAHNSTTTASRLDLLQS